MYTAQEVAEKLGITRVTVYSKVSRGELIAEKHGRELFFGELIIDTLERDIKKNERLLKRYPLSTSGVAEKLGVSNSQVLNFVRMGIPHVVIGGKYRFKVRESRAWFRARVKEKHGV